MSLTAGAGEIYCSLVDLNYYYSVLPKTDTFCCNKSAHKHNDMLCHEKTENAHLTLHLLKCCIF